MFRLFRKQALSARKNNPIRAKIAGILGKPIRKAQTRLATSLSKQESRLSLREKKWALLAFLLSMGSLSGYWVYQGIFSKFGNKPGFLKYQGITEPKNATLPDTLDIKWLQEYKHWQARKDSLPDSLKR
jgi:hypothetical protein